MTQEARRFREADDWRLRHPAGYSQALLPTADLYGANARGKSNFLSAMGFMRDAVVRSHRFWVPDGGVPREPFAWGQALVAPSLFEMTFLVEKVRYRYGFVLNGERFLEEWLYAWLGVRKQTWFEREGDHFKFGDHLKGENRLVEQVTRPDTLFLSANVQLRHEQLARVFQHFNRSQIIRGGDSVRSGAPLEDGRSLWRMLEGRDAVANQPRTDGGGFMSNRLETFRRLIQRADVGIVDFKLEEARATDALTCRAGSRRVLIPHHNPDVEAWLPLG